MTIPRLLVVDDDADMRGMMTEFLHKHGFIAHGANSREDIKAALAAGRVDMILLDVMLGDENGVEICRDLRRDEDVPIILVSALSADHQRMEGYEVGADDYIAKPFNPDLLIARVKAVLARTRRAASLSHRRRTKVFRFAGWTYDAKRDEVISPDGYQVSLSRREHALLQALLANPFIPLTRAEIAATLDVTGEGGHEDEASGRAIDMLVGRLRSKIEDDPKAPVMLRTERGVGYVLAVDVTAEDA